MTDTSRIAEATGIPLPFVEAIRATESAGIASAVRFEPHLFLRIRPEYVVVVEPGPMAGTRRSEARAKGFVPYTHGATRAASDSREETDRGAHDHAWALDPDAVMRSSSYGTFQVLGGAFLDAHKPARPLYPSPQAALAAFDADPSRVSDDLLVHYLRSRPALVAAAKRNDARGFVAGYNGCQCEHDAMGNVIGDGACERYLRRFRAALNAASWPVRG
jgi:hypothetical protein